MAVGWATFWDPVSHILALDVPYLVNMIFQNLWWIFILYAFAYFFYDKKHTLKYFILIIVSVWLFLDWVKMMGWVAFVGMYLVLVYIGRLSALTIAENSKSFSNRLPAIYLAVGFLVLIIFNVFM